MNLSTMTKNELRAACKANGVKGYGNMDNAKMRAALESAIGDVADPIAEVEAAEVAPAKAKKARTPRAPRDDSKPSVRTWLDARVSQYGSVKVEDAKAFVKETGRSVVTMYRQAQELGLVINREKKVFERA
jgi:hypothetical protein